ncbi:hypothetical protein FBU59_000830 [Linderina macrospora]|uniref:Uncharacterized protein n=1 Tax=Linderina macrospora TaxID=4868 RepID=A0ACC1JFS4_9FUNG|nr:hypothetical protein FBU59_000830 [Linderina macrospora]
MSGGTSIHSTEAPAPYTHNTSKQSDAQDSTASLSTMATPRNTFLYPPTGLSISARASIQSTSTASPNTTWDSLQHQRQLQRLLEEKGIPGETSSTTDNGDELAHQLPRTLPTAFDDSYSLLDGMCLEGPATRSAAINDLRRLAQQGSEYEVPAALAVPVEGLGQLEAALAGIIERRHLPNYTRAGRGAGDAQAGRLRRRGTSPHDMDDRRSVVSHASSEVGRTPYADLNDHLDQLTASITRLQTPIMAARSSATAAHERHKSVDSLGANSSMADMDTPAPTAPARLPRVEEHEIESVRDRASSRASLLSGTSAESKRRILVTEVPESSQFQGLFGSQPYVERDLPRKPSSVAMSTLTSSTGNSQPGATLKRTTKPVTPVMGTMGAGWSADMLQRPMTSNSGGGGMAGAESLANAASLVTVRAITPASRQALWLNVYIAGDASRLSLFKRKQWHRRFAIFAGNVMYLFKSSSPAATALQHVRLSPATIVCVNDAFPGHKWVVELTQPREMPSPSRGSRMSLSANADGGEPQSWFLETEQRMEMVNLLKSLKGAVKDLQAQPDAERREEQRLMTRRRKQKKEKRQNADVCPWEVEEFSDHGSASTNEDEDDDDASDDGDDVDPSYHDDELVDEPVEMVSQMLEGYSMTSTCASGFTGTGGIAEWGAHRMQMPYDPAPASFARSTHRAYSTDPSAYGRRPSLADALAPPPSATLEVTPIARPRASPAPFSIYSPMAGRRVSSTGSTDASALIEQMFASASRELGTPQPQTPLFSVHEEEEVGH